MMRNVTRYLGLLLPTMLVILAATACSGSKPADVQQRPPAEDEAQDVDEQQPAADEDRLVSLSPQEALSLSSERSLEVETFRGTFDVNVSSGGFSISMGGDYAFQAPDKMHMTMDVFGETLNMLMILPDLYVEVPGEGWYVISGDAIGIDWEVFQHYVEQRGPVDYAAITDDLDGLQQLPDETIDGVTYLRYGGNVDLAALTDELPEGIIDPAVLDEAADAFDALAVGLWLEKETYLPYRMDMIMDFSVPGETDSFSMEMSMLFFDYNEPVSIPAPPADAKPFDALDF